jgi:hypothetical protein
MITNHILEDKWRVQQALSKRAEYDVGRYMELTHEIALEVQERYGLQLKYVNKKDLSGRQDAK